MIQFSTQTKKMIGDLTTPVSLFLKFREVFPELLLLESSDYSSKEDSKSFLCMSPIATLQNHKEGYQIANHLNGTKHNAGDTAIQAVTHFIDYIGAPTYGNVYNGIFGYTSFDVVQEFEDVQFDASKYRDDIPSLRYDFFGVIVVFDHFFGEITIIHNQVNGEDSQFERILNIINRQDHQTFGFSASHDEVANMDDATFLSIVQKAKDHCQRGDVFQMVLSRRFSQSFEGDEFNVYRALRSINPSPYLFYFDYGGFKIFGSSPEAQMIVKDRIAEIHPIAGTFKRTGDYTQDNELAQKLLADPKENAEHIMLVDLARNDLSKNCTDVKVSKYKEIQFFSHVIHLVSKVQGRIKDGISNYRIFADTFPAGTLSGAPKHKALSLIDQYEPTARTFYGGGLGMISFNGDFNHAIVIRTFLSHEGRLQYQSGAGIVINSISESELQEVKNKLFALRKALESASMFE